MNGNCLHYKPASGLSNYAGQGIFQFHTPISVGGDLDAGGGRLSDL